MKDQTNYLLIVRYEDEPQTEVIPQAELLSRLQEELHNVVFVKDLKTVNKVLQDLDEWPCNLAIVFKVELIVPQAKEVVTQWTL